VGGLLNRDLVDVWRGPAGEVNLIVLVVPLVSVTATFIVAHVVHAPVELNVMFWFTPFDRERAGARAAHEREAKSRASSRRHCRHRRC